MDERPPAWDNWNRRHIEEDHPERRIRSEEVDQALQDPERLEVVDQRDSESYHVVVGQTAVGRLLVVVWIDHPRGRYPIHARQAGRKVARRYYR